MRKLAAMLAVVLLGTIAPGSGRAERTPLARSLESAGFKRIARKHGVTVFRHGETGLIRLGAEGTFPYPPERMQRVLLDYPRHRGYVSRLSDVQVLKRTEHWLIVYQRLNMPVIDDRDFTLFVKFGKEAAGTYWIEYRAVTNRGPARRKGVVRLSLHQGSWQLRPIDGGKGTFARYQTAIDLAGSLPLWMARGRFGDELPGMFAAHTRLAATY